MSLRAACSGLEIIENTHTVGVAYIQIEIRAVNMVHT